MRINDKWLVRAIATEILSASVALPRQLDVELWIRERINEDDWRELKRIAEEHKVKLKVI